MFRRKSRRIITVIVILMMAVSLIPVFSTTASAAGATVYVNADTGNDSTGDGTSSNPYKTFTKGYSMASSGDTLDLTGTFTWTDADETGENIEIGGDATTQSTNGFTIDKNITIQGHGAGTTIIQAGTSLSNAASRVFIVDNGADAAFKDLEIRYGCTTYIGGAIFVNGLSSVTVDSCYIHDNEGDAGGGGVGINAATSVTITNTTISNNTSPHDGNGGGIFMNSDGTLTLTNSTICNNTISDWAGGIGYRLGAGVYLAVNYSITAYITNCTITGNTTDSAYGAGICHDSGTVYLKNNLIANNTSADSSVNDYEFYGGTLIDNGGNIVEYYSKTGSGTGSLTSIVSGNQSNLFGTGVSATPALALNDTLNGVPTIALGVGSIAIDAGGSGSNGTVSVPNTDQRGFTRDATYDIGAYEDGATGNAVPVASSVKVSGTATYGQTLTGSYTYSDADSDPEGTSTFKWYRADDASGTNKTEISGAASETYTLVASDVGKYIGFEVTPVAQTGTSPGTAVSAYTAAAVQKAATTITTAPTASAITYGQTLADSILTGGSASVVGTFSWTTGSTAPAVSDSGVTTYSVTFTPTDSGYNTATTTVTLTVNKATPTVNTVPTASAITYGETLADSTLTGGTASTAGTFAWTTNTITPSVSDSGVTGYSVTFTPVDSSNYDTTTTTVTLTVNKAATTISTAPTASAITYGQTLADSILTGGSASVAGAFSWTTETTAPAVSDSGTTAYSVTFTPTDSSNYNTSTTTVTLTVNKATPTVNTVPTASAITYGETLADSTLTGGTASTAGTFAWTTNTITPSVSDSGVTGYSVTFTPVDSSNYDTTTTTVTLTVNKAATTISTAPTTSAITYGQTLADSTLTGGSGSVAGAFSWTTNTISPSVSDSGVTGYSVTFTPTDSNNFNTTTTTVTLTVNKATPTISTAPTVSAITYGETLADSVLTGGSANTAGTFSWTTNTISPSVSDSGVTGYSVTFMPTDSSNYNTTTTTVTLTVNKAATTINTAPTASAITYGQTLADSVLTGGSASVPGTFSWTTGTTAPSVSDSGVTGYSVTFTSTDSGNYSTATTTVTLTVNKADAATPVSPVLSGKTQTSITLTAITGYEYICIADGADVSTGTWQDSNVFSGLSDNTAYDFYQRIKETATHNVSAISSKLDVTTTVSALTGTASITGSAVYGQTLTASLTGSNNTGTLSYWWVRGSTDIPSATSSTYTLVEADIGKQIKVKITSSIESGTITSAATSAVQKANADSAVVPVLSSKTQTTVTLTPIAGYEYIVVTNGAAVATGTWQDSNVFSGLSSDTAYDFYQRIKETATHKASGISDKLDVTTNAPTEPTTTPTVTPSATLTAAPTAAPEPTTTATVSAEPTSTPTASATPVPSVTPTPTATPVPSATPIPTAAANTRTITGTLVDSNGNAMAGYLVELHSEPMTTVTDANGWYAFYDVDYTSHDLIVKTAEGKKIVGFELDFSEGEKFSTDLTEKGVDITYTRSTETVNIEVKLIPDQSGATISQVSGTDKPQTSDSLGGIGTALLWIGIGVLAVILITLLIIILLKKKKDDRKE